jgi:hypothetical protein
MAFLSGERSQSYAGWTFFSFHNFGRQTFHLRILSWPSREFEFFHSHLDVSPQYRAGYYRQAFTIPAIYKLRRGMLFDQSILKSQL